VSTIELLHPVRRSLANSAVLVAVGLGGTRRRVPVPVAPRFG
jgi:hypothetical protein